MHHVALQQAETVRARFMVQISVYDPLMLVWLDEIGCDRRHAIRKYGYSLRGTDRFLLVRSTRYSVIPIMSLEGIYDVYITEGMKAQYCKPLTQYYTRRALPCHAHIAC